MWDSLLAASTLSGSEWEPVQVGTLIPGDTVQGVVKRRPTPALVVSRETIRTGLLRRVVLEDGTVLQAFPDARLYCRRPHGMGVVRVGRLELGDRLVMLVHEKLSWSSVVALVDCPASDYPVVILQTATHNAILGGVLCRT